MLEFGDRRRNLMDQVYSQAFDVDEQTRMLREIASWEESGCLVRSLESAFQVEATNEEWAMRRRDLDEICKDLGVLFEMDLNREQIIQRELLVRAMDRKMQARYLNSVATHDSLLGESLRRHSFAQPILDGDAILEVLGDGGILLLGVWLPEAGNHIAHVGLQGDQVIRRSDHLEVIDLIREQKYETVVFSPKT